MSDPSQARDGNPPALSIVVPLYDERECIDALFREVRDVMDAEGLAWELILVDDGSRDGTFEAARWIARSDGRVRVLRHRRNYGQSAAFQSGFDHARAPIVVTMDGDLQNDPRDIPMLLEELERGYDIVSGWRRDRHDNWLSRRIPSVVANRIIHLVTRVKIHDHGCSLKAYRREVLARTRLYADLHRFLMVITSLSGGRYRELVVNHRARAAGQSKYGIARTWKVLLDLFTLAMITRFTSRPGHWFGLLSLPFLIGAVIASASAISNGLAGPRFESQAIVSAGAALLFGFGFAQLLLTAILGELILSTGDYRESATVLRDEFAPGAGA